MLYLWIFSGESGKGCYLPDLENWSDHIDVNTNQTMGREPVWMSVQAEGGRWSVTPPPSFQWVRNDGTLVSGTAGLKDDGYLRMKHGSHIVEIIISACSRGNTVMQKFAWSGRDITFGSAHTCQVIYERKVVSRSHGTLRRGQNGIQYTDTSTNGTWVNGVRIINKSVQVKPGDRIFIPPAMTAIVFREMVAITRADSAIFTQGLAAYIPSSKPADPKRPEPQVTHEYHRAPRQIQHADTEPMSIDPPIEKNRERKTPTWLAIGPSTTMVLPMLVSTVAMGRGPQSLVMIACSSALAVMWAMINRRYSEKDSVVVEANRQKICKQYYAEMEEKLVAASDRERKRLNINHLSVRECLTLPSGDSHRMWEKTPNHEDFLALRLGTGECRLPSEISVPKPKIEMTDDPLRSEPQRLKDTYQMMPDAPIIINARKHRIIGVLSSRKAPWLMQSLAVQVAATHSYHDVRMCVLHNRDDAAQWHFTYHMPHIYANDDRSLRMAVCGEEAVHEVLTFLDNTLTVRHDALEEKANNGGEAVDEEDMPAQLPWLMIFVTDPRILEDQPILRYLSAKGLGYTLVIQAKQMDQLPKECDLIIEARQQLGTVYHADGTMTGVRFESAELPELNRFAMQLAPFRIKEMVGNTSIPSLVTFLETYGVRKVEDLDVCHNWNENHAWQNIRSTLGFKSGSAPFVLDISDKNHGPHGLIAGTTGAGKSVLLQSFILSLALNYSPSEVQFILIDYKGGGTSEDFRELPHAAGVIDSLQGERTIFRALASIQGEIKRREAIFKDAGVNSIDDYMKLFNADPNEPTLGHLIIIVDEFAELKKEQPDFMRELVSAARVGRSLGLHLVLATQKPGNSVSDEIDANSRFRICLRVANRGDSTEMLKRPEAAYLKGMGRCYVQVGNNEVFEQVQTSWSGSPYDPEALRPEEEPRILNDAGQPIKFSRKKKSKTDASGKQVKEKTELDAVLEYISASCAKYHYPAAGKMWLPEMGDVVLTSQVAKEFSIPMWDGHKWPAASAGDLTVTYGMADNVDTQRRIPAMINFNTDRNIMISGLSGSGKTTMLQTIAVSLAMQYSPDEVNLYILSLTSHVLAPLAELPHVGEVITEDEPDEQYRLIDMLTAESARRKALFREMTTDNYVQYNRSLPMNQSSRKLPAIVLLVDGMKKIREWDDLRQGDKVKAFYELLHTGSSQGIFLVIAGLSKDELPGTQQKFAKGMSLRQNERADYSYAIGARIGAEWGGIREYPGRGVIAIENKEQKVTNVYETQVAVYGTAESDRQRSDAILAMAAEMKKIWHGRMPMRIARIPKNPVLSDITSNPRAMGDMADPMKLPLGFVRSTGEIFSADMKSFYSGMIIGPKHSGRSTALKNIALVLKAKGADVMMVGPDETAAWAEKNGITGFSYSKKDWLDKFKSIMTETMPERTRQLTAANELGLDARKRVVAGFRQIAILVDDLDKYITAYPDTVKNFAFFMADNDKIAGYRIFTMATLSRKAYADNMANDMVKNLRQAKRGIMIQGVSMDCDPFNISTRVRGVTLAPGEALVMYEEELVRVVLPETERHEE